MDRRDFLVSMLQALLLALLPWLRTARGVEVAKAVAEQHAVSIFGPELPRGVDTVATTLAEPGELQVPMLISGDPWIEQVLEQLNGRYVPGGGPAASFMPVARD